jgi:hypothetical protein
MAAGDGEAVRSKLGVGVGSFWCSSGEDEGTKRGNDLWQSFLYSWLSTVGGSTSRQRAKAVARV